MYKEVKIGRGGGSGDELKRVGEYFVGRVEVRD